MSSDYERNEFATLLKQCRLQLLLPLRTVAGVMGVSYSTIHNWEGGGNFPSWKIANDFERLDIFFGLPLGTFFELLQDCNFPKERNIEEQRFGLLTVIGRTRIKYQRSTEWICQCDCGNIHLIEGKNFRTLKPTRSCGCLLRESGRSRGIEKLSNLTGQTFGLLTVIERSSSVGVGRVRWKTQCSCGRFHFVDAGNLKNGSTQSCGNHIGLRSIVGR
jgi:transcriptional regulator with XRE-family HTH domain